MKAGFNPMRWDCQTDGCFNVKRRPKIEMFGDCFPGKGSFGDVDGIVEIRGCFCLLEWKSGTAPLPRGQERMMIAFTRQPGNIVFVVNGNAQTMVVTGYFVFWHGKRMEPVQATLGTVKERIRKWVAWVQAERPA